MTTRNIIILGFSCLLMILGAVAGVGYVNLQKGSDQFSEYSRIAIFNTVASDLVSALYMLDDSAYQFLDNKKEESISQAFASLAMAESKVKAAEELVKKANRVAMLNDIKKNVQEMRQPLEKLHTGVISSHRQYSDEVRPAVRVLETKILDIAKQARDVNNGDVSYTLSQSLAILGTIRADLSRFSQNRSREEAEKALKDVNLLKNILIEIEPFLRTDQGRGLYKDVMVAFSSVNDNFLSMKEHLQDVEQSLAVIKNNLALVMKISDALNTEVDADANARTVAMKADNDAAKLTVLVMSSFGFVAGLAVTLFVVIRMVTVLKDMASFATAISQGKFDYTVKVREKGEIGHMVGGMRQIVGTLGNLLEKSYTLAERISSGHLRDKLDPADFPGAFSGMAEGINRVSSSYSGLLDSLSLPILAGNKDNKLIYLNRAAQDTFGGNLVNEQCRYQLNSPECGASGCFGNCAMSQKCSNKGETTLAVRGKRMEAAIDAFPLHNMNHEVVGYVEIITDLTEIKDKQASIMRAVKEASEISDRVASASQQLSAQIEQISRGSEVQRDQVRSTATAMEEMNATVLEVARNAGQASEQTENTRKKAEEGSTLVNKVVHSINMANKVALGLQEDMRKLGKQADGIGGVMNVISDIADQTNLLALNAAIEAARAGDAGRGFAVVADEVRKLAEKTMHATQEVGSSISAMQLSTTSNITAVLEAAKNIVEATELANSSGNTLTEIVSLAAANSTVVSSIATAAEEQSATSEEIKYSVDEINRIVAETSEGMVQSAEAVRDLSSMAQDLRTVMERLV